jgi:hypothetical protein
VDKKWLGIKKWLGLKAHLIEGKVIRRVIIFLELSYLAFFEYHLEKRDIFTLNYFLSTPNNHEILQGFITLF